MLVKHIPHSCTHIPSKYRKNFYLVMMICEQKYCALRTGIPKSYSQMMSLTKLFSQSRELFVTGEILNDELETAVKGWDGCFLYPRD